MHLHPTPQNIQTEHPTSDTHLSVELVCPLYVTEQYVPHIYNTILTSLLLPSIATDDSVALISVSLLGSIPAAVTKQQHLTSTRNQETGEA